MRNFEELGIDFSTIKVAVVDDIPVNTLLIEKFLQAYKFQIVKASNGRQALEVIERESPDVLLLDVMMPEMNGFEVTKHLRDAGNNIPVIIMSALNSESDIREGLSAGADDFVTKPIIRERLVGSVMNNVAYLTLVKQNKK
ncbi:MAG: response regulator [Bacteroidaceae bacterium]|nr:response regulator [Bacteroidaceae bacterium]